MTPTDPVDADHQSAPGGLADRLRAHPRGVAVAATGFVVVLALVVALVVIVNGNGEEEDPPAPPQPLVLAAPTDLSAVFSVSGGESALSAEDLAAVTAAIEGYLRAATIEPLEYEPEATPADGENGENGEDGGGSGDGEGSQDGAGQAPPPPTDLATLFTEAAAPRLEGDDRLALSDAHLPHAEYGVSTDLARVTDLAALVGDDGAGLLVAATIDVRMRVRTGEIESAITDGTSPEGIKTDAVVVHRTGELVLQPVDGAWKIGGYQISVTRAFGTATTTTEAAFGARLP